MDRHEWPFGALTIAFFRDLYLAIIMDRHEGPQSIFTISLLRDLYLANIMDRYEVPTVPLLLPCLEAST
jgi:hypothetical protein